MRNIIIFYNHINREYKSCVNLKSKLEEENKINVYLFSIGFEYYKSIALLCDTNIDMVIFPGIASLSDYENAWPFLKANRNVIIINMYPEQILSKNTESSIFPPDYLLNSFIHFVWSQNIKNILLDRNTSEDLIFVNGNIRSDLAINRINLKKKLELANEFNINPYKKWILFAEGRNGFQSLDKKSIENLQELCNIPHENILKNININLKTLELTLLEFETLNDNFFDKYELIYRPHPNSNIPYHINSRIKSIYKYSIYDWLINSDVLMAWNSTTAFEAEMMGLPVLICEHLDNLDDERAYGLDFYKKITSVSQINDELIKEVKDELKNKRIYESYIGPADGQCIERTCIAIKNLLDNKNQYYRPIVHKINKTLIFKKIVYGLITKLMVTLKMFDILKYPKTAFNVRSDIPYIKGNIL